MHVRWFRQKFSEYVYLYKDKMETVGSGYEGRASLFSTELEKGNVSLLLKEVKISDEGPYKCHVSRLESFAEPQLQLTVKRQGSVPLIEVEKHEKDSLKLRCSSQGWYPEPQMVWMDKKGRNITFTAEPARQQDKNSPFSVSSHLYMMRSSNEEVTCVVGPKDRTAHTAQLRTSVKINDHFFESTHPVRLYVSVVVIAFALALMSMAVACLSIRSQERACKEKLREYDSITSQLETARRDYKDQTRVKDAVKFIPNSVWHWICKAAVDVRLDPETAQESLIISEDGKTVTLGDKKDVLSSEKRFERLPCVLGKEGFTKGRRYWEVTVGEKTQWYVGVSKESAKRSGKLSIDPSAGYWALGLRDDKFFVAGKQETPLQSSLKPQRLGVYVDSEEGHVSFYNAELRSHIHTFNDTFEENLFPFFGTDPPCKIPLSISPVAGKAS
ncbi:butyrophilin subfamily 1 member A1-like isoform X2 [Lepisosteus oculatus]